MTAGGKRTAAVLAVAVAVLALTGFLLRLRSQSLPPTPEAPWNLVVVLTDDQRFDTLWAMPRVSRLLVGEGTLFANAFASNPICCPFRSSLLSGGFYSHHTNVLTAAPPNGAARRFNDREALPVWLQRRGYRTALVGKYMNGLRRLAPSVPPGWTRFVGSTRVNDWFHPEYLVGTSGPAAAGQGELVLPETYVTYFEQTQALAFLDQAATGPFFLLFATNAPHLPAQPAGRDARLFPDYTYSGRGLGEADLGDKPSHVRALAGSGDTGEGDSAEERFGNDFPARQLRTLRAVDRAVEAIIAKLKEKGVLERTVIVFTSDNGMLWGEHGLARKGLPYEEAIRVPLVVRLPGAGEQVRQELVAADLDVAATLADFAGLVPRGDGRSLRPLLGPDRVAWREELFFEGYGFETDRVPPWAAVRTARHKYVEYANGERELYDLSRDPYELESLSPAAVPKELVDPLVAVVRRRRGLAITTEELPDTTAGAPYDFTLEAWGGTPALAWKVVRGTLPPGIALAPEGRLSGAATEAGKFRVTVEVRDSSQSPYDGRPKLFLRAFEIEVAPGSQG